MTIIIIITFYIVSLQETSERSEEGDERSRFLAYTGVPNFLLENYMD
jgi:hypothetical protein